MPHQQGSLHPALVLNNSCVKANLSSVVMVGSEVGVIVAVRVGVDVAGTPVAVGDEVIVDVVDGRKVSEGIGGLMVPDGTAVATGTASDSVHPHKKTQSSMMIEEPKVICKIFIFITSPLSRSTPTCWWSSSRNARFRHH